MEGEFLCPLPFATVDRIRFCHSISLIYIVHVAVIIRQFADLCPSHYYCRNYPLLVDHVCLSKQVRRVCLSIVWLSINPQVRTWTSPRWMPFSWGVCPVAFPSCWVGECHNSKFVSWPRHWINPGTRINCPYTVSGHVLVTSLSILTLSRELQSDFVHCAVYLCPNKLSYHTCIQSRHTVCKFWSRNFCVPWVCTVGKWPFFWT